MRCSVVELADPFMLRQTGVVLPADADVVMTELLKADSDPTTDYQRLLNRLDRQRARQGRYSRREPDSRLAKQQRLARLAKVTGWPAEERAHLAAQEAQEVAQRAAVLKAQAELETAQAALAPRQRAEQQTAREAERKVFPAPVGRPPAIPLWVRGSGPPPLLNGPPFPDRLLDFLRRAPDSLAAWEQLETVALLEAVFWARGAGPLRLAPGSEQFVTWSNEQIQLAKYRWLMVNLPHLWARFPPAPDLGPAPPPG